MLALAVGPVVKHSWYVCGPALSSGLVINDPDTLSGPTVVSVEDTKGTPSTKI